MKKRIVIDCFSVENQKTGVSQYALELLKNIFEVDDERYSYTLLLRKDLQDSHEIFRIIESSKKDLRIIQCDIPAIGVKRDIKYLFLRFFLKYDLYHCLNSNLPLFLNKNCIVTIHDLKYLKYPSYLGKLAGLKQIYLRLLFLHAVRKASGIITVSSSTKNDLKEIFGKYEREIEKKTAVIYSGVNIETGRASLTGDEEEKNNIYGKYFLYLGELRPHKNIEKLVKVFGRFIEKNSISDLSLVIAGKMHKSMNEIREAAHAKVIFTGYVRDEDRLGLYKNSEAFFFASLYEGFGFPLLEAMIAGTPVVTSSVSSMPEVGGDAAFYVNPSSDEELEKAMHEMYYNETLKHELIQKGFERCREFDWKKTAIETLDLYGLKLLTGKEK